MTEKKPGIKAYHVAYKHADEPDRLELDSGDIPDSDENNPRCIIIRGRFISDSELSALQEQHAKELEECWRAARQEAPKKLEPNQCWYQRYVYEDFNDYKKAKK